MKQPQHTFPVSQLNIHPKGTDVQFSLLFNILLSFRLTKDHSHFVLSNTSAPPICETTEIAHIWFASSFFFWYFIFHSSWKEFSSSSSCNAILLFHCCGIILPKKLNCHCLDKSLFSSLSASKL